MDTNDPLRTNKPYLQYAYCPEPGCWTYFMILSVRGFDESIPVECPNCHKKEVRLDFYGNYAGDQIKQAEKEHRATEVKKAQEEKEDGDKT